MGAARHISGRGPARALALPVALLMALAACGGLQPAPPPPPSAGPDVAFSGVASPGPLAVRRVELAFLNGHPRITVPQDSRLDARATVRFTGTGPFRASWFVDGQVVGTVAVAVASGDTMVLGTGPATVLPTFEPGPHALTLRVEQPTLPLASPTLVYTIMARGVAE